MTADQNSVKMKPKPRSYHHGALRPALLQAAEELLAERGVDGFSLREAARRAGVSASAPAHHFGDTRGLLTAVAASGFKELGDRLAAAGEGLPRVPRIGAQGQAYVQFALSRPAAFSLMWRAALLDHSDPDFIAAAGRAFDALDAAVRGEAAVAARGEDMTQAVPSIACWSLVHGFARLAIDGAFGSEPGAAERAAQAMLNGVLSHLHV